jgi:hypothetical protein
VIVSIETYTETQRDTPIQRLQYSLVSPPEFALQFYNIEYSSQLTSSQISLAIALPIAHFDRKLDPLFTATFLSEIAALNTRIAAPNQPITQVRTLFFLGTHDCTSKGATENP